MPRDTRTGTVFGEHGSTGARKGRISDRETGRHWQAPRRAQPESGRIGVEGWRRANSNFAEVATDLWDGETKVPFEVLCLAKAVRESHSKFKKAYLVLGGSGWTLREFYVTGLIHEYLRNCEAVEIVSLEAFVAKANQSNL